MFPLKTYKICIYFIKILKISSHMHLFKRWSKYAFAYASMQKHNHPKPSYNMLSKAVFLNSWVENHFLLAGIYVWFAKTCVLVL